MPASSTKISSATAFLGQLIEVVVDRPLNSQHPDLGCRYPVNYDLIPNTLAPDGETLDAYVLGVKRPIERFRGRCIAMIHRLDDNDDKLVVARAGQNLIDEQIRSLTAFQEQFFQSQIIRPAGETGL